MENHCANDDPHHPHQWGGPGNDDWRCPGTLATELRQPKQRERTENWELEIIEPEKREHSRGWERPDHYGGEGNPFEPIKIIEHFDLNFNLGNVIKYVLRAPFKGTALADLKKAYTYIGFEIRRRERAGETE